MSSRKNSWDKSLPSIPSANSTTSSTSESSRTTRDRIDQSTSRTKLEDTSMPPPPVPSNRSKSSQPLNSPTTIISNHTENNNNSKKVSKRQSRTSKKAREPPLISVSNSSSTHSNLGNLVNSDPSEINSMTEEGVEKGVFSSLGLRTSRRARSPGDEVLEEWASADLEEGEGTSTNGKEIGNNSTTRSGKSIFGIKRSRSNLRMFGGGGKNDESKEKEVKSPSRRGSDTSSLFDPRASTSSQSTSHSQPYISHNSLISQSQSQNPNVAGRIGGWFSSMLHTPNNVPISNHETTSSSNSDSIPTSFPPSTPNKLFTFPSPSLNRVASTPKKSNGSTTNNSGGGSSTGGGRLGPLDRMLDKAVQYFLDTDSTADQCEEDIWVLGVRHPGFTPTFEVKTMTSEASSDDTRSTTSTNNEEKKKRKKSGGISMNFGGSRKNSKKGKDRLVDDQSQEGIERASSPSSSIVSSPIVSPQNSFHLSLPSVPSTFNSTTTTNGWPSQFYHDFYSRIALTYRAGFPPIPCSPGSTGGVHSVFNSLSMSIGRGNNSRTAEGLSSDTGWGCMLRTGQSLLANTLVTVHLGRDWRRSLPPIPSSINNNIQSPSPVSPPQSIKSLYQAEYTRILSLFIDDPSSLAPFSVHRFALMGKQLGKEVGEWFGPSTAAGAIKSLVNEFEPAGLKVYSVVDGTVYRSEVEIASTSSLEEGGKKWSKPVLILIGLRLGIDGVNPIYNEGIKAIFQFPQSMGIAGGRPSSSYYFVGAQANSLFYIDPHHPRPSIPLRNPPADLFAAAQSLPLSINSYVDGSPIEERKDSVASGDSLFPSAPISERERLGEFLVEAYSDSALRSYHTEKVRKMSIASLDPSMLLGFLIQDEDDWEDFASRVRELNHDHRPIFAIADTLPAWMGRSIGLVSGVTKTNQASSSLSNDLDTGVESFSEPDDWELDSSESIASPASGTSQIDDEVDEGERNIEEEEWEEAPTGSLDDEEFISTSSPITTPIRKEQGSEDSTRTRTQSWHSIVTPEQEEGSLVVISPLTASHTTLLSHLSLANSTPLPPSPVQIPSIDSPFSVDTSSNNSRIGGAGVLVKGRSDTTVEFEKRDEGWEGVGLKSRNSSTEGGKDLLESTTSTPSSLE